MSDWTISNSEIVGDCQNGVRGLVRIERVRLVQEGTGKAVELVSLFEVSKEGKARGKKMGVPLEVWACVFEKFSEAFGRNWASAITGFSQHADA